MVLYSLIHSGLSRLGLKIKPEHINKFTVTGFCFLIWLSFFDTHSLWNRYKLSKTVDRYETDKLTYEQSIKDAILAKEDLLKDREKFARETYKMHKENEEVIIIE